jgi:hypothetical protein
VHPLEQVVLEGVQTGQRVTLLLLMELIILGAVEAVEAQTLVALRLELVVMAALAS